MSNHDVDNTNNDSNPNAPTAPPPTSAKTYLDICADALGVDHRPAVGLTPHEMRGVATADLLAYAAGSPVPDEDLVGRLLHQLHDDVDSEPEEADAYDIARRLAVIVTLYDRQADALAKALAKGEG